MSSSAPPTDSEVILGRFILDLEDADDPDAVIAGYQAQHPALADRFAHLAAARRQMEQSAEPDELPHRLGDCRLLTPVARGGMGRVFLAEEERLRRRVAVKVIHRHLCLPEYHARFVREQQVLARLHHTDIVPILAAGEVGPFQYFVMPYIEGATLAHALALAQQPECWPTRAAPDLSTLARLWRRSEPRASASGTATPLANARGSEGNARLALSRAYFTSVARIIADAADALHHAHEQGIVHRDVKPSNIMVARDDKGEKCWVIDFGLAGFRAGRATDAGADGVAVSGIMGTPAYMAPEQWTDPEAVDGRTDVWGLGATLYQMVTLQPAFTGATPEAARQQALAAAPAPPRQRVRGLSADLEAVCLCALRRDPEQRYASARALADDLRRCVRGEPPVVARHYRWRQTAWHAGQHKGLLAIVGAVLFLVLGAVLGWGVLEKTHGDAARREALILQAQQLRMGSREAGWSAAAWERVRAAADLRVDDLVRREAAAALAGLDAEVEQERAGGASSVAVDRTGQRLILGGLAGQTARLWDRTTNKVIHVGPAGEGPVAFRDDGTPVQLALDPDAPGALVLWDLAAQQVIRHFTTPVKPMPARGAEPLLAMTPNGTLVAVALPDPAGKGTVAVWQAASGKLMQVFTVSLSALAISPDGALLAGGRADGQILVWSLADGTAIATLQGDRASISSFAFGPDPLRRLDERRSCPWLLAAGSAGGAVTIWDLHTPRPRTYCHGTLWDVYALAFSPDATLLASAGHGNGQLWDVATGQQVLTLPAGDWCTALAFTPDGRRLAATANNQFDPTHSTTTVFALEAGRGLLVLRGPVSPIARVRFAPDNRLLAAVTHDWHVAIWDVAHGRLRHLLEVPKGLTADNAGLAFDADSSHFAFATGSQARLWETATGRQVDAWDLPPGLADELAFQHDGTLRLFRMETRDGVPPSSDFPWRQHPRICLLRCLRRGQAPTEIARIDGFNRRIAGVAMTADGSHIAVEGLGGPDGNRHALTVFDGRTGKALYTPCADQPRAASVLTVDPSGKVLSLVPPNDRGGSLLLELRSGKPIGRLPSAAWSISSAAQHYATGQADGNVVVARRADGVAILTLPGSTVRGPVGSFDRSGLRWTCGHRDGGVLLCDLHEVQRRLATIGLGR